MARREPVIISLPLITSRKKNYSPRRKRRLAFRCHGARVFARRDVLAIGTNIGQVKLFNVGDRRNIRSGR